MKNPYLHLCVFSVVILCALPASGATFYVRGDGNGSDANGGTSWADAFATLDKGLESLTANTAATIHTVNVQASAGATAYDVAYRYNNVGAGQDVHAQFVGGWEDVDGTPTQTGTSRVQDTDGTVDEPGFFYSATGNTHGQGKHIAFSRFGFSNVTIGIQLFNQSNLDSGEVELTLTDVTIDANADGVNLQWPRAGGDTKLVASNVTIKGGQNSGTGHGVYIKGRPDGSVIDQSSIMSDGGRGIWIDVRCRSGNWGPGFTMTISNTVINGCTSDAIYLPDFNWAHYNTTSTVNLNNVRITNNQGRGFYRDQDNGNGMRPFALNASNVLIADNTGHAIELRGDFDTGGSKGGAYFLVDLKHCTLVNNGGDGIYLRSDQNSGNTFSVHNNIFANLGGDGLDLDDGDSAGITVAETHNNFFNITGNPLNVHGANVAANGADFTNDPPFSNELPDIYRLLNGSPLLDAGDPSFAPAGNLDLLGVDRGAIPSIGAYEQFVDTLEARPSALPTLIVIGQTFTLSSSPFRGSGIYNTFAWTGPDIPAGQESVEDPGVITPSSIGIKTYTLTTTDSLGVPDTDTVTVTVNPPVSVSLNATAQNPSLGDVYDLFSTPTGGFPPYTYAWTGPGAFSSTAQNPTNVVPPVMGAAGNVYTLTVTDALGNTGIANITLFHANSPLTISATATPAALLIGGTTALTSSASGGSGTGFTFAWTGPNGFSSVAQNPGTITPPLGANAYTVTVTDSFGLTASIAPVLRVVNPLAPNPSAAPPIFPIGGSTLLSAAPTGGSGTYVQYAWTGPDGFSFNSSSSPNVTVTPPNAGANDYMLTVTDDLGFSGTATVTVYPVTSVLTADAQVSSTIGGIQFNGSTGAVIAGESATLFATVSGGSGQYSFSWTGPNGFSSNVEDPGAVVPVNQLNTYTLTVTDTIAGDSVTDSVTVSVVQEINTQTLSVLPGGMGYHATTQSTQERPVDWFRLNVKGLDLNPGDRLNFSIQNSPIGSLNPNKGLVWDGTKRVKGQVGEAPSIFHKCTLAYNAKKRVLKVTCKRGSFASSGGSALVVQSTSGLSNPVPAVIYIDRAPSDGLIDDVVIMMGQMRVKARVTGSGDRTETGRMMRSRR